MIKKVCFPRLITDFGRATAESVAALPLYCLFRIGEGMERLGQSRNVPSLGEYGTRLSRHAETLALPKAFREPE